MATFNIKKSSIILSAPFNDKINGHITTANLLKDVLLKLNFNIILINQPSRNNFSIKKYFNYLKKIISLLSQKEKIFYVLIHRTRISFFLKDLPLFLCCFFSKSRIVVHLIGGDFVTFFSKLFFFEKKIILFFLKRIDTWVVLGKKMENDLNDFLKKNKIKNSSKFIHNPGFYNETEYLNFKKSKKVKKNDVFTICFMSNFILEKGIIFFIEMVIDLVENHKMNVKAKIAGEIPGGFENEDVANAIELGKTKKYISFEGFLVNDQKWSFLTSSHIFVLPTFYQSESLPLVMIDAMRAGCYCISTKAGEIPYILSQDRGVVLNDLSNKNLVKEVIDIYNNPDKLSHVTSLSKRFVKENLSSKKYEEHILDTIKTLNL